MSYAPYLKFPKNLHGRDLYATDIHGCFTVLQELLALIGFDESKDRLFLGGDLVDRGPDSRSVLEWLRKPWVHSVMGNHEQICIQSGVSGRNEHHIKNGGAWFADLTKGERGEVIQELRKLPFAIEVEGKDGRRFGLVHAECPHGNWDAFLAELEKTLPIWLMGSKMIETALWEWKKFRRQDTTEIVGLDRLFVGHIALHQATTLGNVRYMDTGVCFTDENGYLSVIDMNTEQMYDSRMLETA